MQPLSAIPFPHMTNKDINSTISTKDVIIIKTHLVQIFSNKFQKAENGIYLLEYVITFKCSNI